MRMSTYLVMSGHVNFPFFRNKVVICSQKRKYWKSQCRWIMKINPCQSPTSGGLRLPVGWRRKRPPDPVLEQWDTLVCHQKHGVKNENYIENLWFDKQAPGVDWVDPRILFFWPWNLGILDSLISGLLAGTENHQWRKCGENMFVYIDAAATNT